MLTDSGGFQVFSLASLNAIKERGVTFQSPRDGSVVELTPERSMAIQEQLGADVAMAFDQCPPYPASHEDVREACGRTHRWLERCVFRPISDRIRRCLESCKGAFSKTCAKNQPG